MKKFKILVLMTYVLCCMGCYRDNLAELTPAQGLLNNNECDTAGTISYSSKIAPLLSTYCGVANSCHSGNNTSGYDLSSYTGVHSVAKSGQLQSAITWDGTVPPMPLNGSKLSNCNINKIQKWISQGTLNN